MLEASMINSTAWISSLIIGSFTNAFWSMASPCLYPSLSWPFTRRSKICLLKLSSEKPKTSIMMIFWLSFIGIWVICWVWESWAAEIEVNSTKVSINAENQNIYFINPEKLKLGVDGQVFEFFLLRNHVFLTFGFVMEKCQKFGTLYLFKFLIKNNEIL